MSDQKTKIIIETDAGRSEQVLRSVQKGLQGVGSEARSSANNVKSGGNVMDSVFSKTAISAAALGVAVKSAFSMAKEASQLSEARLYLQTFASEIGVSFSELERVTKKASNNLVDDLTLIRANHKALKLGVTSDVNDIARLWQIADAVGDELGQSMEQTFEQITRAISEGNGKALLSLGLLPESFKRASDAGTLLQRRTELLKEVLNQAGAGADNLAKHGDTTADKFGKFDIAVKNLKTSFGEALIPLFLPIVEGLTAIANAAGEVIKKFGQLADMSGPKNPFLGKTLEELKKMREASAIKAVSLEFELESFSRPASQGGKAGPYTEAQRQQLAIQVAGEKQILQQIDAAILQLEKRTKARADAQSKVVAVVKEEKVKKEKITDAQKAFNKAQEIATKQLEEMLGYQVQSFGKAIENSREAIQLFNAMTAAAGGFAVGLGQGQAEAGKLYDEIEKLDKKAEEFSQNFESMLRFRGYNAASDLRGLSPDAAMMGMMDFMTGGLFTAKGTDKNQAIENTKDSLSKTIAEAVTAGFANADFSNFALTLGSILSNVLSKSVSAQFPVFDDKGGVNLSNLGINLGVSAISSFITRPGRFFGGTEIHGQDNVNLAKSYQNDLDGLWAKVAEIQRDPLTFGAGLWNQLRDLQTGNRGGFGYQGNYSGDGIFSDKTLTYEVLDFGGHAKIEELKGFVDKADRAIAATEYEIKTLQANQSAKYYQNLLSWYEMPLYSAEASKDNNPESAKNYYQMLYERDSIKREFDSLKVSRGDRGFQIAMQYGGYAPNYADSVAQNEWMSKRIWYGSPLVNHMLDKDNELPMQPMIRSIDAKNQKTFELASLAMNDPEKYAEAYSDFLEKQQKKFEDLANFELEIVNNMTLSIEEREAAIARYEQATSAYYQAKLDQLAIEQQKEEELQRKRSEQRQAQIESTLSLVGELNQRQNGIVIIQGGDTTQAIKELMEEFADNPAVVAILQDTLDKADAKARWGN